MRNPLRLCVRINEYEYALFSGQAKAECRSISALLKYATMQYCKAYPAKLKAKEIFTKYVPPDEVFHENL